MPSYQQLKALQDKYAKQPFRVLLFPCNDFCYPDTTPANCQEPNSNTDIREFATCTGNHAKGCGCAVPTYNCSRGDPKGCLPDDGCMDFSTDSAVLFFKTKCNPGRCPYPTTHPLPCDVEPGTETCPPGSCTAASDECCADNTAVYDWLRAQDGGRSLEWNFDKFIIDQEGNFIAPRFNDSDSPDASDIEKVIDGLLANTCKPMTDSDPCFKACHPGMHCTQAQCVALGKIGCNGGQCMLMGDSGSDSAHCMSPM